LLLLFVLLVLLLVLLRLHPLLHQNPEECSPSQQLPSGGARVAG